MTNEKFWDIRAVGDSAYQVDLYGYVGGSKEWGDGFNDIEFVADFRKIPSTAPINISINSFGGSAFAGLAICNLLATHEGPVTIRVDGVAMSAATLITSTPRAKVVMPQGAVMMIHGPMSAFYGNTREVTKQLEALAKIEDQMVRIYMAKTGKSEEEIRAAIEEERYFSAEEAVEFGLADEVDGTTEVAAFFDGEKIFASGQSADAKDFQRIPTRLFRPRAAQSFSAAGTGPSAFPKEDPKMDLDTLRAEHPDLVQAIRDEAVKAERERISAIDALTLPGFEDLAAKAKFDEALEPSAFAMKMVEAQKASGKTYFAKAAADAKDLDGIGTEGSASGLAEQADVDAEARNEFMKVAVAAYNRK